MLNLKDLIWYRVDFFPQWNWFVWDMRHPNQSGETSSPMSQIKKGTWTAILLLNLTATSQYTSSMHAVVEFSLQRMVSFRVGHACMGSDHASHIWKIQAPVH